MSNVSTTDKPQKYSARLIALVIVGILLVALPIVVAATILVITTGSYTTGDSDGIFNTVYSNFAYYFAIYPGSKLAYQLFVISLIILFWLVLLFIAAMVLRARTHKKSPTFTLILRSFLFSFAALNVIGIIVFAGTCAVAYAFPYQIQVILTIQKLISGLLIAGVGTLGVRYILHETKSTSSLT